MPVETIVLTKTAGQQPDSGHCCLRSSVDFRNWVPDLDTTRTRLFVGVSRITATGMSEEF